MAKQLLTNKYEFSEYQEEGIWVFSTNNLVIYFKRSSSETHKFYSLDNRFLLTLHNNGLFWLGIKIDNYANVFSFTPQVELQSCLLKEETKITSEQIKHLEEELIKKNEFEKSSVYGYSKEEDYNSGYACIDGLGGYNDTLTYGFINSSFYNGAYSNNYVNNLFYQSPSEEEYYNIGTNSFDVNNYDINSSSSSTPNTYNNKQKEKFLIIIGSSFGLYDAHYFKRDIELCRLYCEIGENNYSGNDCEVEDEYFKDDMTKITTKILSGAIIKEVTNGSADSVREIIENFVNKDERQTIIYCGHGEIGTGSWMLEDSELSIEDFKEIIKIKELGRNTTLMVNCCFSYKWQSEIMGSYPPFSIFSYADIVSLCGLEELLKVTDWLGSGREQIATQTIQVNGLSSEIDPFLVINGGLIQKILQKVSMISNKETQEKLYNKLLEITGGKVTINEDDFYRATTLNFNRENELSFKPKSNEFNIYVFPGSDGDCSLVELDGKFILIDGGRKDSFKQYAWEVLKYIDEIEYVVLTHYDADHIYGLLLFFEQLKTKYKDTTPPIKINNLLMTYDESLNKEEKRGFEHAIELKEYADNLGINVVDKTRGDIITIGEKGKITILNPSEQTRNLHIEEFEEQKHQNPASICLLVEHTELEKRAIFTGDTDAFGSESNTDDQLFEGIEEVMKDLKNTNGAYKVDYIDLPHHASPHSSDCEFWKKVQSTFYIVSGNGRAHRGTKDPNPSIECLKNVKKAIEETDRNNENVHFLFTYKTDNVQEFIDEKPTNATVDFVENDPKSKLISGFNCFKISLRNMSYEKMTKDYFYYFLKSIDVTPKVNLNGEELNENNGEIKEENLNKENNDNVENDKIENIENIENETNIDIEEEIKNSSMFDMDE